METKEIVDKSSMDERAVGITPVQYKSKKMSLLTMEVTDGTETVVPRVANGSSLHFSTYSYWTPTGLLLDSWIPTGLDQDSDKFHVG